MPCKIIFINMKTSLWVKVFLVLFSWKLDEDRMSAVFPGNISKILLKITQGKESLHEQERLWMKYKQLQRDFKIPQVRLLLWLDIFFFRTVGLAYAKCYKIILYLEHGISKQVAFFSISVNCLFSLVLLQSKRQRKQPLKNSFTLENNHWRNSY